MKPMITGGDAANFNWQNQPQYCSLAWNWKYSVIAL